MTAARLRRCAAWRHPERLERKRHPARHRLAREVDPQRTERTGLVERAQALESDQREAALVKASGLPKKLRELDRYLACRACERYW